MTIEELLEKYKRKYPGVPYEIASNYGDFIASRKDYKFHSYDDAPAVISRDDSKKFWYKRGLFHRENDKPAFISSTGEKEYWYNGEEYFPFQKKQIEKLTPKKTKKQKRREDLLKEDSIESMIIGRLLKKYKKKYPGVPYEYEEVEDKNFNYNYIVSKKNGKYHSYGDAPAVIEFFSRSGVVITEEWVKNGKIHRENDKPALIEFDSEDGSIEKKEWWYNGKRHRENDKPAIITLYGEDTKYFYNGKEYDPLNTLEKKKKQINKLTAKKSDKQRQRENLLKESFNIINLEEVSLDLKIKSKTINKERLNKVFDLALKEIFTKRFYDKIQSQIKKIKIKEYDLLTYFYNFLIGEALEKRAGYVRFNRFFSTGKINISKNYTKTIKKIKIIILHEFIHILQSQKFLYFFNRIREFEEHSKRISDILEKNIKEGVDLSNFFGYVSGAINNFDIEAVAYLVSSEGKLRWNFLEKNGKKELTKELKRANIFNINSKYWKERLR